MWFMPNYQMAWIPFSFLQKLYRLNNKQTNSEQTVTIPNGSLLLFSFDPFSFPLQYIAANVL